MLQYRISISFIIISSLLGYYFYKHLPINYITTEIVACISIAIVGYFFGIKNYLKNNTPTAFTIWISFSIVAMNEASDIIFSPTSHHSEVFLSIFGVFAATLTATILIDNLKISQGTLKGLWENSAQTDKNIIFILIARIILLIIMENCSWGNNKFYELGMVGITFSLDVLAYIAIKSTLKEFPESESFRFWICLWISVSLFSIYQIFHIYNLENFFSIGLFVYLENIIFFGAVTRIILIIKFPNNKLSRIFT